MVFIRSGLLTCTVRMLFLLKGGNNLGEEGRGISYSAISIIGGGAADVRVL